MPPISDGAVVMSGRWAGVILPLLDQDGDVSCAAKPNTPMV
jgi:hypothetical protein